MEPVVNTNNQFILNMNTANQAVRNATKTLVANRNSQASSLKGKSIMFGVATAVATLLDVASHGQAASLGNVPDRTTAVALNLYGDVENRDGLTNYTVASIPQMQTGWFWRGLVISALVVR
jgi:hypothetical protein